MKRIYAHKFTFTPMVRSNIRSFTVIIESEQIEMSHFDALLKVNPMFDENCNVEHTIIAGFKDESITK